MQEFASYDETQETLALLKILALGIRAIIFKAYRLIYRVICKQVIFM